MMVAVQSGRPMEAQPRARPFFLGNQMFIRLLGTMLTWMVPPTTTSTTIMARNTGSDWVCAKTSVPIPQMTLPSTAIQRLPFLAARTLNTKAARTLIQPAMPVMALARLGRSSPQPRSCANAAGYQLRVSVASAAAM